MFLRHLLPWISSVKAGSPVFIPADQALRSASVSSPCQNQGTTKERQISLPFLSAPVVELADTMDLGDVTLVKGFCYVLTRDLCTVVDKHLEGDAYGASGIKRKLLSLRGNDFQNSI